MEHQMTNSSSHTVDETVNSNVLSARDLALRNSSPIVVLLVSISLIFGCIFVVFILWSRNRRIDYIPEGRFNPGIQLKEDDLGIEYPSPSNLSLIRAQKMTCDVDPLRLEMNEPSSPKFIISAESEDENETGNSNRFESFIELRQIVDKSQPPTSAVSDLEPTGSTIEVHQWTNLTLESLAAAHERQLEQRERFIHDRHNIGLRHLAIKQILVQQRTEKQIMRKRKIATEQPLA